MFDSDFLEGIAAAPYAAALKIIDSARSIPSESPDWTLEEHAAHMEAYALISAMIDAELIVLDIFPPEIPTSHWTDDCKEISLYFAKAEELIRTEQAKLTMGSMKAKFAAALKGGFAYEFSQADVNRMQTLINELRTNISASELFSEKHKARLLKRLEGLQAEVHKRVSDLDKFWGMIGDAGVVMGKFGTDAKPFVDRIVELSQIVWNAQKEAEELPSNAPMPLLTHTHDQTGQISKGEHHDL